MVYPSLLPLMGTPRLPVVEKTDALADLNGLVPFAERRNLVFARVPSHFKRSLPLELTCSVDMTAAHISRYYTIKLGTLDPTKYTAVREKPLSAFN
jgi:hypothetical protein